MTRLVHLLLILLALFVCVDVATHAQRPTSQQRTMVTAWNECGASIERENKLIEELTKSLQLNPPWRVTDAREPAKRAKLIDQVIAEHEKRIELLKKIKREDGQ